MPAFSRKISELCDIVATEKERSCSNGMESGNISFTGLSPFETRKMESYCAGYREDHANASRMRSRDRVTIQGLGDSGTYMKNPRFLAVLEERHVVSANEYEEY
jgi:hypothetical protein